MAPASEQHAGGSARVRSEKTTDERGAAPPTVTVQQFNRPQGFDWAVAFGVALNFVCFGLARAGLVEPGSAVWGFLEAIWFPGGPTGFKWLVNAIFLPVLAIHVTEVWWLDRTRLVPNGVRRGSILWWLWMGSCFFEGVMAFKRFDRIVEGLRSAKQGRS